MAYIFASNPDALAGQKNFYDQTNIQLAERDRALRQQALDTYQQRQLEAQARADQQAYQFQQLALSQAAQAQNRADQQAAITADAYRFKLGREDTADANKESKRRFEAQMDLQKSQMDFGKAQNDYAQAYNDIQAGNIETAEDIGRLYPGLSTLDTARATAALTGKQKGEVAAYNQIASAAQAATGFIRSQTTPKPVTSGSLWWKKTETPPAVQLDEEQAMNALAQNKNFAKALPHLSWDESTQSFMPNIPKPAILSSPTPTPAPTPSPALAIPPITPITIPSVAPTTQPQPAAASSPSPAIPKDRLMEMARKAKRVRTVNDIPLDAEGFFLLDDGSLVEHNPTFAALPVPPRNPSARSAQPVPSGVPQTPEITSTPAVLQPPQNARVQANPLASNNLVSLDDPTLDSMVYSGFTGGEKAVSSFRKALRTKEQAVLDRLQAVKMQNPGKSVTLVKRGGQTLIGLDGRPFQEPVTYYAQIGASQVPPAMQPTNNAYQFRIQ